uniref:Fras1 related extracellular matrix protein 2b n=1 Tax=Nothobranchius rachovii TaxID=451742 RepID=A0A1A8S6K4_9TELE
MPHIDGMLPVVSTRSLSNFELTLSPDASRVGQHRCSNLLDYRGWQHLDLQSELRLTFVYDTAILWREGIGSPPEAELQGALYPTSMRINVQGQLVVNFRTEARFRHPSAVSNLNFIYVRSEPTYNQPVQQWTFTSDFAVRDYSGMYTVKLIPCTSPPSLEYTIPPVCNPREALSFDLDIRFQQVSDPVAAEFSLNTQMLLLSKRTLWLSDGSMGFGQETDTAFSPGDTVYGRVMVDPVQNLGDSFICNIEKVFLCTGADGYVPKYNPSNFEFGCLADAPSLLYRFKIIDKAQPETQAHSFGDVAFNAFLAVDDPGALPLVRQPGADGFRMDSSALFQVAAGREWYIHSIYTVRSRTNANRGIGKRSLEYHVMSQYSNLLPKSQHRSRRSASDVPDIVDEIGEGNNRGTNILHIALDRSSQRKMSPDGEIFTKSNNPHELNKREGDDGLVLIIGVFVGLLFTVLIVIVVVLLVRAKREKKEVPRNSSSAEPMMMTQGLSSTDSSEV